MTMVTFSEAQLRHAVAAGDIVPAFQPVVSLASGRVSGTEVLARWRLPDGIPVPPDAFIPQAEACGLILPLTAGLMATASRMLRDRPAAGPLTVGFNAGPACLQAPGFLAACRDFMAAFPGGRVKLAVEVTEREPLTTALTGPLGRLRAAGAVVVLDDYGTGYATESVLDIIRPDVVKTDRSLTRLAGEGDPDGVLATCLAMLESRPGVRVLAEGVETEAELAWLRARDVPLAQGYLFGRPTAGPE